MFHNENTPPSFWQILLSITIISDLVAMQVSLSRWQELGVNLTRSIWGGLLIIYFAVLIACVWMFIQLMRFGKQPIGLSPSSNRFDYKNKNWRWLGIIGFSLILILIPCLKFNLQFEAQTKNPSIDPVLVLAFYYWVCWWMLLLAMAALRFAFGISWQAAFAYALTILGVAFEVIIRFNEVTAYPFSMGWSEASRYYYASLYFSERIYGESLPLPTLHPSRYLLQSIPFLIPSLGLTAHRFWQFLLWTGLSAAAALALARRVNPPQQKAASLLLAGWVYVFLMRVGVYYHLEVMVILCLLFVSPQRPWRTLIIVVLASLWAGISRINWFPMPAIMAIVIYVLETPLDSSAGTPPKISAKRVFEYFSWPLVWAVAGLASALFAQLAYIPLSGNAANGESFASSLTSDLLWNRLWPNENYQPGVVMGILTLSAPFLLSLFLTLRQSRSLHPIRWAALWLPVLILFAGGLVVSVKIGGGGDLHNLDTYAVLICIVAVYLLTSAVKVEPGNQRLNIFSWNILTISLVTLHFLLIPLLAPHPKYAEGNIHDSYARLMDSVNEFEAQGPILFINQRHLVTFGDVDVPLVPDYEAVTLMEMAMSRNMDYLNAFYNDLARHRFAAIVVGKQNLGIKLTGPLAEENNAWNTMVSPYIKCYYHPIQLIELEGNKIEIYVPALETGDCP